jgi:hypothetical protein
VTDEEERLARNEVTFREANERVETTARRLELDQLVPFICECGRPECMTVVRVTTEDYERVRREPTRFLYAAGHDQGMVHSRVVETLEGAVVVEKLDGPARIAIETDPRATSRDQTAAGT